MTRDNRPVATGHRLKNVTVNVLFTVYVIKAVIWFLSRTSLLTWWWKWPHFITRVYEIKTGDSSAAETTVGAVMDDFTVTRRY